MAKILEQMASYQNIELLNEYEDELTQIRYKCRKCNNENEDYPEMMLSYTFWCTSCRQNPCEILEKLLCDLGITIADRQIKKMFDYKIERQGQKAFI